MDMNLNNWTNGGFLPQYQNSCCKALVGHFKRIEVKNEGKKKFFNYRHHILLRNITKTVISSLEIALVCKDETIDYANMYQTKFI